MSPYWLPLIAIGSIYVLWAFYLAVMNLARAKEAGTLTKTAYYFGLPLFCLGLFLDWLVNLVVKTLLFLEPPDAFDELVTYRLKRHAYGPDGWRKTVALWYALNFLDTFDPSGKHI